MKTRRLSNGPKVAKEEKRAVDPKVRLVMKTIHENQISNQNSFVMDAAVVQVSKPVVITRHEDLSRQLVNVSSSWWSGVVSWTSSFPAVLWGCPGRSRGFPNLSNRSLLDHDRWLWC